MRRSSRQLGNEMEPLARQLRDFTEPLTGDDPRPLVQQLVPLTGEIATLVAYVLKTSGDPAGTGRHNLAALYDLATRLAEVSQAALLDEP